MLLLYLVLCVCFISCIIFLQHLGTNGLVLALHCCNVLFLVADYYKDVISQLKEKQQKNGGETTHPKVAALVREMSKARSRIDPNDNDLKVGG